MKNLILLIIPLTFTFGGITQTYTIPHQKEEVIAEVAREIGVYPADLLAICIQESGCGDVIVGNNDYGKSSGFFQIHRMQGVFDLDFYDSALWTARNLLRNGYSKNYYRRFNAIWRHNGQIVPKPGVPGNIKYPRRVMRISDAIHRNDDFFNPPLK